MARASAAARPDATVRHASRRGSLPPMPTSRAELFHSVTCGRVRRGRAAAGLGPDRTAEVRGPDPAGSDRSNNSKYWCYVEKTPGTLVRVEVDTSRPTGGGYFVTGEIKPGDPIAITAVSRLARKGDRLE